MFAVIRDDFSVEQVLESLPTTWRNVSNLPALDAESLMGLGIYPAQVSEPESINPKLQRAVSKEPVFDHDLGCVLIERVAVDLTAEERKAEYERLIAEGSSFGHDWRNPWLAVDYSVFSDAEREALAATYRPLLLQALADSRWQVETGGVLWNDIYIATDRESQAKLNQEVLTVERGRRPDGSIWKCGDAATGAVLYRATTNAEILAIGEVVSGHVRDCFQREAVMAGEVLTLGIEQLVRFDIDYKLPASGEETQA